jgi:hypothetical protein
MRLLISALFSILAIVAVADENQQDNVCPEVIWPSSHTQQSAPIWVSATRAVDANHNIDWDFLGEAAASRYETVLLREQASTRDGGKYREPKSGIPDHNQECLNLADSIAPMSGLTSGQTSTESLIQDSAVVFHGEITAIDYGFFTGRPGSLLRIETQGQSKAYHRVDPFPYAYVYFFNGTFDVGDTTYCNQHSLFPYTPQIGDSITVISGLGGLGEDGRVFVADGFIFFTNDHRILPSPEMEESAALKTISTPYEMEQLVQKVLSSPINSSEER